MQKNIFRQLIIACMMISASWTQDRQKRPPERIISKDVRLENVKEARRDLRVGCIFVASEPLQAEIRGIQDDSLIFRETTPILLCDRVNKVYQIVFTYDGFKERRVSVKPKPGRVDTLRVILEPITPQKKRSSKGWRWIWSGITAAGVVGVTALIFKSDRENSENKIEDLPVPPDRP